MAGTRRANEYDAPLVNGQISEQRLDESVAARVATGHEAGSVARSGDPAARPDVQKEDASSGECIVAALRVLPVRVTPVHCDVLRREQAVQSLADLVSRRTVRYVDEHDP